MPDPVLQLDASVAEAVRARLPTVAVEVVAAVVAEVPSYQRAFSGTMGKTIEGMVALALGGFLDLASRPRGSDPTIPLDQVTGGAYDLGRGEARAGRSMEALLSAYRVGARVAWRGLSASAVTAGLPADEMAGFAELVFAYIDQLSAASVAGHSDELETAGRVRERYLERLATRLLEGAPADALMAAAERAEWTPPETLTVVLLPVDQVRGVRAMLHADTLVAAEEVAESGDHELTALLVPDVSRPVLIRALSGRRAVVGPVRPWLRVGTSYRRALRAKDLGPPEGVVDTDEQLTGLVLHADAEAHADLRARALSPLDELSPVSRRKLEETLRAWLLCQGRRDDVAGLLFVHPQTVRYRMGQLRELFGDRLTDPEAVLELVLALGAPAPDAP